jgi:hypothetical protein
MLDAVNPARLMADNLQTRRMLRVPDVGDPTQNETDAVAAHFQRHAPAIHSVAQLLADPTSLSLMQRAIGFSLDASAAPASQMDLVASMINVHDFQIPSRIQRFIELYRSQANSDVTPPALWGGEAAHTLLPAYASSHVSDGVLESLQSLRVGGT